MLIAALPVGFLVVFGAFAVAFLVLCFLTLRWAVRRDRVGRKEWLRRRQAQTAAPLDPSRPPGVRQTPGGRSGRAARSNGHSPGRPS